MNKASMKAIVIFFVLTLGVFARSNTSYFENQFNAGLSIACSEFRIGGIFEMYKGDGIGGYLLFRLGMGGTDDHYVISIFRGLMSAKTEGTPLQSIILPPIDPDSLMPRN